MGTTVDDGAALDCEPPPAPEPRAPVPECPRSVQASQSNIRNHDASKEVCGTGEMPTHSSHDPDPEWELSPWLYKGIDVEDFMEICFKDKAKNGELKDEIRSFSTTSSEVRRPLAKLRGIIEGQKMSETSVIEFNEEMMYEPFVQIGNAFLKNTEKLAKQTAYPVRLHVAFEARLAGADPQRKPDVVLIPASVKTRIDQNKVRANSKGNRVHTAEHLLSLEFRRAPKRASRAVRGATGTKRRRDDDDGGYEGPANKSTEPRSDTDDCQSNANAPSVSKERRGNNRRARSASPTCGFRRTARLASGQSIADAYDVSSDLKPGPRKRRKYRNNLPMKMQTDAQLYKPGDYGLNTRRTSWSVATAEARKDDPTGRVQLAAYVEEQMSFRGDRSYVFGVRVAGSSVALCYYDRSAIVEAKPFDVLEDPFYLGWFLAMFQDDPSTYGFNAMMGYHDPFQLGGELSKPGTLKTRAELTRADGTYNRFSSEQPNDIKLDDLEVVKEIASHYEVVGRGTSVFRAHAAERKDLVVKFCWQVETRRN